ncbi:RNA-dependent RNA polymerase [Fusarium virguliforme dsRNA mycovirus 2]|uniref:RNA-directed RNA polymerase n=1 Tax=Fusarium virguliforme dsRNA mycovirus 2 TaxID=1141582 RepID=H6UNN0_9VIRU|nr:RNA-dependent RNA polymerase [Fusarium virguliforme dsRNA mycovirus 2]
MFYDFESAVATYKLNQEASDITHALMQYIFFTPAPPSVCDHLPGFLLTAWDPREPVISKAGFTLASKTLHDSETIGPGGQKYMCYPNMDRDEYSCATRLLTILGLRDIPMERKEDIHALGIPIPVFRKLLMACWHSTFHLDASHQFESATMRREAIENDIQLSATFTPQYYGIAPPVLIVILYADHVAFALRKDWLASQAYGFVASDVLDSGSTTTLLSIREVIGKFPRVTGRAGGKVFLNEDVISACPHAGALPQALLNRLEHSPTPGWEQILPINLFLLLFLDEVGEDLVHYLINDKQLFNLETPDVVKRLKEYHTYSRLWHKLPCLMINYARSTHARDFARRLYGLDTLPGRSQQYTLDFTSEQVMRSIDPVERALPEIRELPSGIKYLSFNHEAYYTLMPKIVRDSLRVLTKDHVTLQGLTEFFSARAYWGASGGAPGAKVTWDESGEKLRLNKRGALLALREQRIRDLVFYLHNKRTEHRVPVQWSTKAIKYEAGKLRSILNTTVEHYVLQGFITANFEANMRDDSWYSVGHSNPARIANQLRRLADLSHSVGYMWDYADFNINHNFILMAEEILARIDVMLERCTSPSGKELETLKKELYNCAAFTVTARFNTYLSDNDTGIVTQAKRGLQSGERDTSRVNSDSNDIDTRIVRHISKRMLGYDCIHPIVDESGDDAFETTASLSDAMLASSLYNLSGAAGQVYKISVSLPSYGGAAGEFLRLPPRAANRNGRGDPNRAVGGFSHGEVFSEPVPQPAERMAAFISQRQKLSRRGWHCPDALFQALVRVNCRLRRTLRSGKIITFVPDPRLVQLPAAFGGIGIQYKDKNMIVDSHKPYRVHSPARRVDCFYIPSGEGKTMLSMRHPTLFADHDSIVSAERLEGLRALAMETGDWSPTNAYLASCADLWAQAADVAELDGFSQRPILLTWGPDTVPKHFTGYGLLLKQLTGLRANKANRRSLMASGCPYREFSTWYKRDAFALACVGGSATRATISYSYYESKIPLPVMQYPTEHAGQIIRRSKTVIPDFEKLTLSGVESLTPVYADLLQSSFSGAWPKTELYDAIANYAGAMHEWQTTGTWRAKTITIDGLPTLSALRPFVTHQVVTSLGLAAINSRTATPLFNKNKVGYPAAVPVRHHYNGKPALLRPLGLTVGVSLTLLFDPKLLRRRTPGSRSFLRMYEVIGDAVKQARHQGSSKAILRDYQAWLSGYLGAPEHEQEFVARWLTADLSLLPPSNTDDSADLVTFIRDITCYTVEKLDDGLLLRTMSRYDAQHAACFFMLTERAINHLVLETIQTYYPGVSLKD